MNAVKSNQLTKKQNSSKSSVRRREAGYSLLEYAAGAAILLTIMFGGMQVMKNGIDSTFTSISNWMTNKAQNLDNSQLAP